MSRYRSNFLTNVILKLDFPTIPNLDKTNPPTQLQSDIKEVFPIFEMIPGKVVEFEVGNDKEAKLKEVETAKWHFFNKEKTKIIELSPESIIIEYYKYKNFDDFSECYEQICKRVFSTYSSINTLNRIGLRYINQIKVDKGNPFDWKSIINDDLVFIGRNFVDQKQNVKKSMQLLETKVDSYNLKFQFGMFNSEYPNPIARKEFVLDYDCSLQEELKISDMYGKVKEFKKIISDWFEKSIGDELRNTMGRE